MCRKSVMRAILNNGSVPRDMGLGGALQQDAEADLAKDDPIALPKPSQNNAVRAALGIDTSVEVEPFGLAEEAVAAVQQAKDRAVLEGLAGRWQHFEGMDAEMVARAYEDKLRELGGGK